MRNIPKKMRKMNDYIKDLFDAVKKVNGKYVQFRQINGLEKSIDIKNQPFFKNNIEQGLIDNSLLIFLEEQKKEIEKSLESIFCYELYHCWSQIINSQYGRYKDKLVLNGEIGKINLSAYIENYNNSKNNPLFKELSLTSILENGYLFPDFTLHSGNNNMDNQKLIVEVKTNENITNDNFKTDFYRLAIFQKIYGFESVVFIILNKKIKDLVSYLENVNIELVDKNNFYFILKSIDTQYCIKLDDIK